MYGKFLQVIQDGLGCFQDKKLMLIHYVNQILQINSLFIISNQDFLAKKS